MNTNASEPKSAGVLTTGTAHRACEACHRKKTRCDMQQPVCGLCRRTNKECHFPSTRKRPVRQEPSERAKILRVNENLDRLVELLEAESGSPNAPRRDASHDNNMRRATSEHLHAANLTTSMSDKIHHATLKGLPPMATMRLTPPAETSSGASSSKVIPVPRDLALHLIDLFFEHISSWCYIFHQPTFAEWSTQVLVNEGDALSGLRPVDAMIFCGIFALAARFSNHETLTAMIPRDRGEPFLKRAEHHFKFIRDNGSDDAGFAFLQACVLLATCHYACGSSKRGWYITHMCIRGCYDLGLHQIDGEDDLEPANDDEWIDRELLRRTFWMIWDVDAFGSIVKQRPFGIDRRHVEVKLPVSDEAWFAGRKAESGKFVNGPEVWKSLAGGPNQDERAWCILAKSFVGHVHDLTLSKGISDEDKSSVENNLTCFRLAMPDTFQLGSLNPLGTEMTPGRRNFIIAAHLYLAATGFRTIRMSLANHPTQMPSPEEAQNQQLTDYTNRVVELSEIVRKWPPDHIQYVFPSLACTLLTYDESLLTLLPPSPLITSYRDLSGLVLAKFAEKWSLGAVLLRIRDIARDWQVGDEGARADLVRQYPVYFHRAHRTRSAQLRLFTQLRNSAGYRPRAASTTAPSASVDTSSTTLGGLTPAAPPTPAPSLPPQLQQPQQPQPQSQTISPPQTQTQTRYPQAPSIEDEVTISDNVYDPSKYDIPDWSSFSSLGGQSPTAASGGDLDAIFSGFLQEPMWQDFGGSFVA